MAGTNTDSKSPDMLKKTVCDMIDQILGGSAAAQDSSATPDENKDGEQNEGEAGAEDSASASGDDAGEAKDAVDVEGLKQELEDSKAKVGSLEAELQETKDALAAKEKELEDSKAEVEGLNDKCIALATANKELVADSVISQEIAKGLIEDEAQDSRREELLAMSMKDLNKTLEDVAAKDAKQPRHQAQVTNPTLANTEKDGVTDSNGSADANKKETTNTNAKKTVDDFAKDIVGKLVK